MKDRDTDPLGLRDELVFEPNLFVEEPIVDPFGLRDESVFEPNLFVEEPIVDPFGFRDESVFEPNLFVQEPNVDEDFMSCWGGMSDARPAWVPAAGVWRAGPPPNDNGNQQSSPTDTDDCAATAGEYCIEHCAWHM